MKKTMGFRKAICIGMCFIMLSSCAGLFIGREARAAFERGLALFNQGNYEDAIEHFTKAAELDPEYTKAYLYLGRSYLNLSRWVEAIPPLRTAYSLSPQETKSEVINILLDALIGGALSQIKKGNFTESIGYLKEALDIKPDAMTVREELVRAMIGYGGQLLSQGKASDAISQFSGAIELAPGNMDAYLGLAESFLKNGDFISAVSTIQKALQIAPTEQDRSIFRELLQR